ncbi:hypothetical protein EQU27_01030 [Fructilactobacillus sanfranciscensis]|uniref:hypothetical protein n=1 Tax=Fructilactobacillus sanfranciscensis TaxID=1625 RepID=UPI001EF12F44|nr:hypothetical protein [Fructilactobacillus sanfranciscensis]MCG7195339.1 hypothetical protein [Fructilactobacillus sanfranciscensis]
MNDENDQQNEGLTRSQLKKHHIFGRNKLNHFKDELDKDLSGQATVGSRSERDTSELKQKRLGRRLNVAIFILALLLILVLLIMRFMG